MSVPQNSLQKRREHPSKGPEHKVLRKIASTLLNLDFSALRTLQEHEKSKDYQTIFVDFTAGNLANIKHDDRLQSISRAIRRHVARLSKKDLYEIVSKPFKSDFYREMIYLGIQAFEDALEYEKYELMDILMFGDPPPVPSEAVHEQLCDILHLSRSLYNQIKDAAASGYLRKSIPVLKEGLRSIDEDIEDLCSTLGVQHEPLVYLDDTDER
ncbi:hypothetical protein PEX1_054030 [Penicillium expansum]|uniref:Uncharacterized protein n=1 Tax=Penicillium expansum TaxID=27334 RepID=A0A0A2J7Z4_PENEN|nr:hypothetical protein PEX2_085420 [Penicillium expansum]KGO37159.1 hypothetical protein PEXP_001840 [Penicillium expansum]KGO50788.1 hypothetical protein PEX1_054030 [Penicillium expansum]KGO61467.1 hypothetical protein PEX2_085420 [Penicillium expansum]